MTSYRFSYMKMKGLQSGNNKVTTGDSLNLYPNTPTKMTMRMHMPGVMYGVTDNFTVAGMASFVEKDMDHIHRVSGKFNRETDGIGDSKINGLYQFYNDGTNRAQFNLGISLPTGSINKKQPNQASRLPYPMQIGSGSYELLPGLSFTQNNGDYSFGAQVNAVFRLDSNKYGYKLGDSYNLTSWVAKEVSDSVSLSSRLDYHKNEAVEGVDTSLNPNMIATANGNLQDRERLDLLFGVNYVFSGGYLAGNRLAVEFGAPVYQRVAGPILGVDYRVVVGWQKGF